MRGDGNLMSPLIRQPCLSAPSKCSPGRPRTRRGSDRWAPNERHPCCRVTCKLARAPVDNGRFDAP